MSESRQQRRARERAAAKAADRPGPNAGLAPSAQARRARVIEIELDRLDMDDEDDGVWWHTTWGWRDDSVGHEDSGEDLQELMDGVLAGVRPLVQRDKLALEWKLGGDPPQGATVAEAVAALGVELPSSVK